MYQYIYLLLSCLLLQAVYCQNLDEDVHEKVEEVEECLVWDEITQSLDDEENVEMRCFRNKECSGLDCLGDYVYEGMYSTLVDTNYRFCFGMVIEPCTSPPPMQIYIGIFDDKKSNVTTETVAVVSNSTQVPINGISFDLVGQTAQPILDITMNHTMINNKPHIFLEVVFRVVVKVRFLIFETSPTLDDMEVTIVEPMFIPVPPCLPNTGNHTRAKGECKWNPSFKIIKHPRIGTMSPCSGTNNVNDCQTMEMCENKVCVCIPPYQYNNRSGVCYGTHVIEFDTPEANQHSGGSKKNTVVIVCSVVGALVLIAISAVVVIIVRRHRARYAGMQLVLSEDNDDDLEVVA